MEPEAIEQKLSTGKVLLSSCAYSNGIVVGEVFAAKMDQDQHVTVRYTTDGWKTYEDTTANDGGVENGRQRYIFEVELNEGTLEFAVCFRVNGEQYWDNNGTKNYTLVLE